MPELGERVGTAEQGGIAFTWRERVSATEPPLNRRIDVQVFLAGIPGHVLAQAVGYAIRYPDREAGFTLVEMLVAIAIFGVLAVAGYRVLDTVLVTRERVTDEYRRWRDVARAVAWMERDLEAAQARPVRNPADQVLAPVLGVEGFTQPEQPAITFTRGGGLDASGFAAPPSRIGYRVRDGALERLAWPALDQATQSEPTVAVVLRGVSRLGLRYRDAVGTWRSTWPAVSPRRDGCRERARRSSRLGRRHVADRYRRHDSARGRRADPEARSAALRTAIMTPRARSRGFAAISAILVAGTVAGIGTFLAWQGALATRQAENIAAARQARQLVHAAAASAVVLLAQDDPRVDHRGEAWARSLPAIRIEGATVTGLMTDEQGKFNVNNLADSHGVSEVDMAAFRRLLGRVGLPESLADAVADWIDADDEVTAPHGAEDAYYVGRAPSYRAANREIVEIGELLFVKGFSAERLHRLAPYVTALPGTTRVNVNAASAELLSALLPGLTASAARAVVAARDKQPFGSKLEFSRRLPESAAQAAQDLLDIRSDYFVVSGTVRAGRISAGYRALVGREGPAVRSITQELG